MDPTFSAEIRGWTQLAFAVIGGSVALAAFFQNMHQRKVDNALKFISNFKDSVSTEDWESWRKLLVQASEPAGAKHGTYLTDDGCSSTIGDYFSEGSPDGHSISRMAESLEVICHQALRGYADCKTIYYELGQPITTFEYWLSGIEAPSGGTLLKSSFPSIGKFAKKFKPMRGRWPSRVIAYVE